MQLLVVGGTGFLGRQICLAGLKAGHAVTALSRRGVPDLSSWPLWSVSQMKWKQADVFDPHTYQHELEHADAVVHSMGTLLEDSRYKKLLDGQTPDLSIIPDLLCGLVKGSNPLEDNNNNSDTSSAYLRINRDSALVLAKAFSDVAEAKNPKPVDSVASTNPLKPFVYISAEDWNPLINKGYIDSKRQAEQMIDAIPNLRPIFVRPGYMFDADAKNPRTALAMTLKGLSQLTEAVPAPIEASTIASAVIEAIEDPSIDGPIPLDALEKYSTHLHGTK